MFKHVLLCADGSPRSDFAMSRGIALVRAVDAKITVLHVIPVLSDRTSALQEVQRDFAATDRMRAEAYLRKFEHLATQSDVLCDTLVVEDNHPDRAIVRIAAERHCDLIVMASSARKGIHALLPGSGVFNRVLVHAESAVLMVRRE